MGVGAEPEFRRGDSGSVLAERSSIEVSVEGRPKVDLNAGFFDSVNRFTSCGPVGAQAVAQLGRLCRVTCAHRAPFLPKAGDEPVDIVDKCQVVVMRVTYLRKNFTGCHGGVVLVLVLRLDGTSGGGPDSSAAVGCCGRGGKRALHDPADVRRWEGCPICRDVTESAT